MTMEKEYTPERYYEVKFELYGKKMKTTLMAKSEAHAKELIASKIIFHGAELAKEPNKRFWNDFVDDMDIILDVLKSPLKSESDKQRAREKMNNLKMK